MRRLEGCDDGRRMTEPCFLSPPVAAGREALEAHLETLRAMNPDDPLVRLAIEDTEFLLAAMADG